MSLTNRCYSTVWGVCIPKAEGGLGIRKSKCMNTALISKVGWRLMKDTKSLWAKTLRSEYKVGNIQDRGWFSSKGACSSTWRSVKTGIREVIYLGHSWVIGDGRQARFWSDRWLLKEPLVDRVVRELPADRALLTVDELWRDGSGWDMANITPFVSEHTLLNLAAVVVDSFTGANDRISWGMTQNGQFTVQSAYKVAAYDGVERLSMESFYRRAWHVRVPERVKVFLWLVGNQVLMTNKERQRRHLCDSDICTVCKAGSEDIIHVLRDCPAMSGIWLHLVPFQQRQAFFNMSLLEWMFTNLARDDSAWATIFAVAVWWGWKWRCGNVFGENRQCRDRVKLIRDSAKEFSRVLSMKRGYTQEREQVERLIKWTLPENGWMKLNTDGASQGNPGRASAGGVLRNEAGDWVTGLILLLILASALLLWRNCGGVYYGLYMAWERRVSRLVLEVDSEMVVGFLTTGIGDEHPLSFLVRMCHGFIDRDWIVRVTHVFREANRVADGLANYAFSLPLGFHGIDSVPLVVSSLLSEDITGPGCPRRVWV